MQHVIPEAVREYLSGYAYKIELHAHTSPCSGCSHIPPREMVQRLKAKGYDAVVIANHFYSDGPYAHADDPVATYLEDFRIATDEGEKLGLQVLLGAEFRFTENMNDYLIYGVDETFLRETFPRLDMGIEAFYREYANEDRLILQAHPFRNGMTLISPAYLDGIEMMNLHPHHNSRVGVAARYTAEQPMPVVTLGTDLHDPGHEGIAALRTRELPTNGTELVRILRGRDCLFEIGGYPLLPQAYFA